MTTATAIKPAPRDATRAWARAAAPIVTALATAALTLNLLAFTYGESAAATLAAAWAGTWGTAYGAGQVLFKATPLLFAGAAVHAGLRAGLFNIGVEGRIIVASLAAAWVGAKLPAATPAALALPVTLLAAAVAGAAWASLAGALRAYRGAHEVISTIMLNRIAAALATLVLGAGLALPGTVRTPDLVAGARLPRLGAWVAAWDGSAVSVAIFLGALVALALERWGARATVGREMRWIGLNARACAAEGIPVAARRVQAMALSGALAGLAVSGTILGYKGYWEQGLGAGAGFGGIAVALLSRGTAVGLVASAILFGTLDQAGLAINARVPREAMDVLAAVAILALAAADRAAAREAEKEGR